MKINNSYELVKEIIFEINPLNDLEYFTARIYKVLPNSILSEDYCWDLNHYFQDQKDIDPYVPTGRYGNSILVCENQIQSYINRFKNPIGYIKIDFKG
ncbi:MULTISPECIES: hypothetical protein [unclassified Tenacibaculum]|uniref:hypothetical protein n=1 Tax=unclassified Tenacibaculum TaxID=2635139 RepID=UPI001F1C4338|nr:MULTISPECIES: hypothetical protein [unclassified Tenacibaculum]MCF2874037.1 hypothetical protein [Tenacibaculum sp. Cn5-1]MCF2934618.1 hypothetical protein [Tenacibaculum sp. Cn5-34]MCG7510828.1 hypothetical protein [Tenacibaculum sp. Cn5-46]